MKRKTILALCAAALAVLVGLTACSSEQTQGGSDQPTVSETGKSTITVTLPANATTGYSWEVQRLDDGITAGEPEYKPARHAGTMVGVGGRTTVTFAAAKAGTATATLVYRQPWNGGDTATIYRLTVTAADQNGQTVFTSWSLDEVVD